VAYLWFYVDFGHSPHETHKHTYNNLPRLAMLWSSNVLYARLSEVNVVFTPSALQTSQMPFGPNPHPQRPSDVRPLFFLNIVPV
jgi:hypothetical protein